MQYKTPQICLFSSHASILTIAHNRPKMNTVRSGLCNLEAVLEGEGIAPTKRNGDARSPRVATVLFTLCCLRHQCNLYNDCYRQLEHIWKNYANESRFPLPHAPWWTAVVHALQRSTRVVSRPLQSSSVFTVAGIIHKISKGM